MEASHLGAVSQTNRIIIHNENFYAFDYFYLSNIALAVSMRFCLVKRYLIIKGTSKEIFQRQQMKNFLNEIDYSRKLESEKKKLDAVKNWLDYSIC